jgi:hypothetical protein
MRLSGYRLITGNENKAGFQPVNKNGVHYLQTNSGAGWFAIDSIDMTGVTSIQISGALEKPSAALYTLEIRLDSAGGRLIGKTSMRITDANSPVVEIKYAIVPVTDEKYHSIYFTGTFENTKTPPVINIGSLTFR